MNKLWYKDPKILLNNMGDFFPTSDLTKEEKINSLARLALYLGTIILMVGEDTNWLILSLIILGISYFMSVNENFNEVNDNCQMPTKDNPFMNYTVSDLIDNPNRSPACEYEKVKDNIRTEFRASVYADSSDLWGRYINDRNFYTTPNTEIVNDQTGFAQWCFGNSGECKTTGENCLKVRDPVFHRGRIIIDDDLNKE
jgi:hypothetical protein